jgi:hypothetical protein
MCLLELIGCALLNDKSEHGWPFDCWRALFGNRAAENNDNNNGLLQHVAAGGG